MSERPLLSLSMIVRNEERTLGRCLASIRSFVDEIVIVDTGSTDQTPAIAAQFGVACHRVEWQRDFAAARQAAMDHARGEWLMWLDADDIVEGAGGLHDRLSAASTDTAGFCWKYINARDEYGHSISECWRERCVRNDGRFLWTGRVHEVLMPRRAATLERDPDVQVVHYPEPRDAAATRRNLELLREEHAAQGDRSSARLLLYLGLELSRAGQDEEAIEHLRESVARSTWTEQNYQTYLTIAASSRRLGRFDEAIDAALAAVKLRPREADAYFSLAETSYFQRDWESVVHWADVGRRAGSNDTACVINPMNVRYHWIIHYTNALGHLGRLEEALRWTNRALEICPRDPWHVANRAALEQRLQGA